ncbi:MAG: PilZ domain-containing protein [Candidatus Omnitrophica bacterium]|nr:PilZ domain-containing protein [Candidatus Omnitrophota bacterium]
MQEHRKIPRWQINQQAKVRLEGAVSDALCHIKDINFKGMQVILGLRLIVDTYVNLRLILSPEISIDAQVWVAWHKTIDGQNTYGLYFNKITAEDKEKIYKFVYKNVPNEAVKGWSNGAIREKGGEKMEDHRIFQRFNLKMPVRLLDLDTGEEIPAETNDISAKGMGLRLKQAIKINTPFEAWVHFPDRGEPLYTRGRAVWSKLSEANEFRAGVELEAADLMGLSRILRV